ncbi:hypothetical protein SAMN04244553_1824 [Nocardia amikacinitolerans]|uniref:Uncharacterized protein n=1 Tax=Nocardia amikacinitolerans TaxID=756689 RepID=A0A285L5B9_9NOCA|nr:hypothetical protein [Nocardia amikacinitolerans]MCP2297937.1 hypothetical protein [Nocardia amikacinitolerans]SNY80074.1 hypothetical protein SAMN04244553_1824 [Nocardia amikacinitolerans]
MLERARGSAVMVGALLVVAAPTGCANTGKATPAPTVTVIAQRKR